MEFQLELDNCKFLKTLKKEETIVTFRQDTKHFLEWITNCPCNPTKTMEVGRIDQIGLSSEYAYTRLWF